MPIFHWDTFPFLLIFSDIFLWTPWIFKLCASWMCNFSFEYLVGNQKMKKYHLNCWPYLLFAPKNHWLHFDYSERMPKFVAIMVHRKHSWICYFYPLTLWCSSWFRHFWQVTPQHQSYDLATRRSTSEESKVGSYAISFPSTSWFDPWFYGLLNTSHNFRWTSVCLQDGSFLSPASDSFHL